MTQMKAKEKEMKDEKEAERQVRRGITWAYMRLGPLLTGHLQRRILAIREKRTKKEEAERYEKLAEKMHHKRVERLKRKEKRNKMLNS